MSESTFSGLVTEWYDANARELPWRGAQVSPWGVLVSEIMLQQTPVARVVAPWEAWLQRWPTPTDLAGDSPGEAVRMWGRLGYPRRALRLHESAVAMVERHGGDVPPRYEDLLALPGVGGYTAAAVAAFGFGQRQAVLDTNVRRVHARYLHGVADTTTAAPTKPEREEALDLMPDLTPAKHSVAVMELGALVCTARTPRCEACPVLESCAWNRAGRPAGPSARRPQTYAGTDRQVRGRLLGVLRDCPGAVDAAALEQTWADDVQRERALAALIADGLVQSDDDGRYRLPA